MQLDLVDGRYNMCTSRIEKFFKVPDTEIGDPNIADFTCRR